MCGGRTGRPACRAEWPGGVSPGGVPTGGSRWVVGVEGVVGDPRGLTAGRAQDRHGAGTSPRGPRSRRVLTDNGEACALGGYGGVEMRPELKAAVLRWMSCAVVRMVATAGSSAACRCTASAVPHRAGLRPAWSSSGGPGRCHAAPVGDHGQTAGINCRASRFPVRRVMRGRLCARGRAATAAGPPALDGAAQRRRGACRRGRPQLGERQLRVGRVVLDPPVVDDGPVRHHPVDAPPVRGGDVGPRDQGRSDGHDRGGVPRAAERVAVRAARGPVGAFARREPARPTAPSFSRGPGSPAPPPLLSSRPWIGRRRASRPKSAASSSSARRRLPRVESPTSFIAFSFPWGSWWPLAGRGLRRCPAQRGRKKARIARAIFPSRPACRRQAGGWTEGRGARGQVHMRSRSYL